MEKIAENLNKIKDRIAAAARRAGRDPSEITLISVSKTKPIETLNLAYDAGVREFGENKVQEMTAKHEQLPTDIKWHMIGHLQRNKVKYLADYVTLIHSVDSYRLAEEISVFGQKKKRVIPILIEVNVADEATKFGVLRDDVEELVREISSLSGVKIMGLMTVAPYVDDPEENRPYFAILKQLSVDIASKNIDNVCMDVLSMGMTGDFEVAIEEGATMVRVGTGIFGARNYS